VISDEQVCAPDYGMATVECGSSYMKITISTDLFNDDDTFSASLVDDSSIDCRTVGSLNDNSFTLETPLDGCGTTSRVFSSQIEFSQVLHVETHSTIISVDKPIDLEFSCFYPTQVNAVFGGTGDDDMNFEVVNPQFNATYTGEQTGVGEFSFDINFFTDRFYTDVADNLDFESGDYVYFGINPTGSSNVSSLPETVTYSVDECRIVNDELGIEFPILEDGCGQALVGFVMEDPSTWMDDYERPIHNEDSIYFQYRSFRFVGADETTTYSEQLKCDITVCDKSDTNSICAQPRNCARRRRSSSLEDLIILD